MTPFQDVGRRNLNHLPKKSVNSFQNKVSDEGVNILMNVCLSCIMNAHYYTTNKWHVVYC